MKGEIPMRGGGEYDALSGWKKYFKFKPGTRKKIKRGFRKRVRRFVKSLIKKDE